MANPCRLGGHLRFSCFNEAGVDTDKAQRGSVGEFPPINVLQHAQPSASNVPNAKWRAWRFSAAVDLQSLTMQSEAVTVRLSPAKETTTT